MLVVVIMSEDKLG